MNYPKKPCFNLYESRHCAYITYSVKNWFLKNLSVPYSFIFVNVFFVFLMERLICYMNITCALIDIYIQCKYIVQLNICIMYTYMNLKRLLTPSCCWDTKLPLKHSHTAGFMKTVPSVDTPFINTIYPTVYR